MNVTDSSARLSTQGSAMRTGALVHNLGSFLLELGRTIMTLRMGQNPVGFPQFRFPSYNILLIMILIPSLAMYLY